VILHVDPPTAHTIHIEPLTASDWESRYFLQFFYSLLNLHYESGKAENMLTVSL